MKFLTRFQRLERSRTTSGASRPATGDRFQAIEPSAPLPEVHPAGLERFAPPVEAPLELLPRSDAQPFVRCPACGVDSPLGSRRCGCGTALDTLEAVAFNTALWDAHREELARHEAEHRRTRQQELEAARRLQQERQALGEEIARQVAAREGLARSGLPSRFAGAVLLLGLLALVLLPRGPLARGLFAFLLGAVCVRAVVAWARVRRVEDDPGDQSSVHR
ncbi:MAG TPA: hypothetical protein VLT82_00640 [Myxococcaceae bacterium]|nr:hypothetical protein [Myxococcaceae bacterium]